MLGKLFSRWRGAEPDDLGPLSAYHAGDVEAAERLARERLASAPDDRAALLAQAFVLVEQGKGRDAIALGERLLAADRKDAQALLLIARAHAAAGRRKPAAEALQAALQLRGSDPAIRTEHALLALADGRIGEAAADLDPVRSSGKRFALAHRELAGALLQRGQRDAALQHLQKAIAAHEGDAIAHANLGALLKDLGRGGEAATSLERALALDADRVEAAFNLAMLRIDQQQWTAGAALLRQYLATQRRDAEAHYWLGNALMGEGDAAGARAAYEAAVRIDSQHVRARWGLAMAQLPVIPTSVAEQEQGAEAFARELDRLREWCRSHAKGDAHLAVGSQQPFYLAYQHDNHAPLLRRYGALCTELMATWARRVKVPAPQARRDGKLRIGIVSAHVQSHSVWHALLRGWVEHLDRSRFELQVFHTGATSDAETRWAAGQVERLHQGLGDWTAWAKAVSDARLDVIVYPEIGMDATSLRLACLRLARVQLAAWGHPLTSGLPTLDGYLSAEAFEPADAPQHYTEKLHPLPGLGCFYRPYGTRAQAPDLAQWGVAAGDRVLVAPGVAFKYGPGEDALWVDIARRCAPCKLLFFRGNDRHAERLEQRLRDAFAAAGVDFEAHVRFLPWLPQSAFFGLLQRADVFLDTLGFSGFNTAIQAVECGTPMVAWEGRFMRGRFASSMLRSMEMDDWVADSHEAYAQKVERLCADAALRQQVRAEIAARRTALFADRASVEAFAALLEKLAA